MRTARRISTAVLAAATMVGLGAGPALAHECVNASKKNGGAGAQVVFGEEDAPPVWVSNGLKHRIDNGLVDPETGDGFHGLMGFDLDGDGAADVTTWIVGPDGEIPMTAQLNGPACKGVTNIAVYFTECLGQSVPE